jgi:hypothetical protein
LTKPQYEDCIITEAKWDCSPNNMNSDDGFCQSKSRKTLICSLKNHRKHPSQDSVHGFPVEPCRSIHIAFIRAPNLPSPGTHHPKPFLPIPASFCYFCPFLSPILHAYDPCTQLLSHPPWSSARHTLLISPMFPDLHYQPFSGTMLVTLALPPIGLLCSVRSPMETGKLSLHSYWFFVLWASQWELTAVLRFHPIIICKPKFLVSGLLCLLPASCWFLAWFILQPWRWKQHLPLKHQSTFNGLYGVISQKIRLLTTVKSYFSTNFNFYMPLLYEYVSQDRYKLLSRFWHFMNCNEIETFGGDMKFRTDQIWTHLNSKTNGRKIYSMMNPWFCGRADWDTRSTFLEGH